jgi:hypothetical protein
MIESRRRLRTKNNRIVLIHQILGLGIARLFFGKTSPASKLATRRRDTNFIYFVIVVCSLLQKKHFHSCYALSSEKPVNLLPDFLMRVRNMYHLVSFAVCAFFVLRNIPLKILDWLRPL